jgi:hypothetical protein
MGQKSFFDIRKFFRPGKNMVIEMDDDVEYILDDKSVEALSEGKEQISVIRVIDRTRQMVTARRIRWAISKEGIIDYLDN